MPSVPLPPSLADLPSSRGDREVSRLSRGGQFVVWTVRAIAVGHGDCPALARMFHLAFGADADPAFMAFLITVRAIGLSARRRLRLHAPGCLCVSPDETALLAVFAAAQSALADGDDRPLRRRLNELVEPTAHETLLPALQAAAGAMEVHGYRLDSQAAEPGLEAMTPAPRTLH